MVNKKMGIVLAAMVAIVVLLAGGYVLMKQNKIANTEISLKQMCEGGAKIYDAEGTLYTTLDIKKAAGWVESSDIPEAMRGVDEALDKEYSALIIAQFMPESKEQEILAKALEKKYSHEEMEEFYLNTVYLGDGVFGLSSAAKHLYGCEFQNIPAKAQKDFSNKMVSYLKGNSYEKSNASVFEDSMIYEESGYIDGVVKETATRLIAEGADELAAYNQIFFGNLSIYTYLDQSIQTTIDEAYADRATFTAVEEGYNYIQSAMVIMDHDGHIKAVAGGNNGDKIFNRALSRNYQVGSTIKPVSTYALGIESGKIHFSTPVDNRQEMIKNAQGEEYLWPSNSDREYGGQVLVTRALQESKNTVAVQIGRMVGEQKMFRFLDETLGFDLVEYENGNSDAQLSALTLGYFYKGVTLSKITSAYEIFANEGKYSDTNLVQKVVSSNQEELVKETTSSVQAISLETAYITNRLLYNNVNGEYGIAKAAQIDGVEVLGKTGTTGNDEGKSNARFFIGITGDYIAGVWIGYDIERTLNLQSYYNPDEIFANVMAQIPHSNTAFEMPEGVLEQMYCEDTGKLATEHCQHTAIGYYTMDNLPEECSSCGDNK